MPFAGNLVGIVEVIRSTNKSSQIWDNLFILYHVEIVVKVICYTFWSLS